MNSEVDGPRQLSMNPLKVKEMHFLRWWVTPGGLVTYVVGLDESSHRHR
jgi:hypothetical protein